MIVKCLVPIIMSIMLLMSCNLIEEAIGIDDDDKDDDDKKEALIDTTVSVSAQSAVITCNDGFSIIIPQGLTASQFSVKVEKPQETEISEEIKILNSYDINLSFGNTFNSPLTITIPFDVNEVENSDSLKAVYYDEVSKSWVPFESAVVQNGSITFNTNHLTVVGVVEFLTNGGYAHKFTGAKGVVVYFNLSGKHSVMNTTDYGEYIDQPYHIPTTDPLFAPTFIQDIAFAIKDAREVLAADPHSLQAPGADENVTVYVKNLKGTDGQFGTVSGAIYINNSVTLPTKLSGISKRQVLQLAAAHEYLHFVQDYYYVMNNASIGQWWLEAIATQADRMVWGDKYTYGESEIYSVESKAGMLDNLSRSWDDCSSDPNWYLAGCFLNYLSSRRDGTKLNIASVLKAGGSSNSIYRIVLNDEIESQLSSDLGTEFTDYVRYLFEEGNENMNVLSDGIAYVETNPSFNITIQRDKNSTREEGKVGIPYLAAKIITLKNSGIDTLKTDISRVSSTYSDIYLCQYDKANEKLTGFVPITNDGVVSVLPNNNDKDYILIINGSISSTDTVRLAMARAEDAKIDTFQFMRFTLEASNEAFNYSDGKADANFEIGMLSDQTTAYRSIESVFKKDGTFSIISEKVTGAVVAGGLDNEAISYDSCRLTVRGIYKDNILYNIEIVQNKQVIAPNDALVKNSNGRDTLVNTIYVETSSLTIDTVVLDQSSQYFTYFKLWNGNNIQPHVPKLERSYEKYAEFDNKVQTIIPATKINSIDWGLMVTMTMYCGKK